MSSGASNVGERNNGQHDQLHNPSYACMPNTCGKLTRKRFCCIIFRNSPTYRYSAKLLHVRHSCVKKFSSHLIKKESLDTSTVSLGPPATNFRQSQKLVEIKSPFLVLCKLGYRYITYPNKRPIFREVMALTLQRFLKKRDTE